MPYFTDPVTLMEFASFEEGVRIIEENLKAKKGNTIQVYKLVYPNKRCCRIWCWVEKQGRWRILFFT